MKSLYYNVKIGKWEPFIEQFNLKMVVLYSLMANPRNMINLEIDNLNINISKDFLQIIDFTKKSLIELIEE